MTSAPDHRYPVGTVRALLDTAHVTAPTRKALQARLGGPPTPRPDVLGERMATLAAVCARLLPQADRDPPIDVAGTIHAQLATGMGDGWRYADLPPDEAGWRQGLAGIDQTARAMFGGDFTGLTACAQDSVLRAVQAGSPAGAIWRTLPAARFFETLLAGAVEVYYAHPWAQEEIGYAGMADAPGWRAVGLGEREPREPGEIAI